MTNAKAFFLSAAITAAVLTPIFATAGIYALTRVQETDKNVQGIAVVSPTNADKRTVLVMTGSGSVQTASTAAVIHFDALNSRLTCFTLPINTVLLADGKPVSLSQAAALAGPSQCAAAICETLGIDIDNYIYTSPNTLCDMADGLSNVKINLTKYLPASQLSRLQMQFDGIDTQVLTPYMFYEVLDASSAYDGTQQLRADGYLAFLTTDTTLLQPILSQALRTYSGSLATDITAQDIYIYDRIFKFLGREAPQHTESCLLSGIQTQTGVYELNGQAVDTAKRLVPNAQNDSSVTVP